MKQTWSDVLFFVHLVLVLFISPSVFMSIFFIISDYLQQESLLVIQRAYTGAVAGFLGGIFLLPMSLIPGILLSYIHCKFWLTQKSYFLFLVYWISIGMFFSLMCFYGFFRLESHYIYVLISGSLTGLFVAQSLLFIEILGRQKGAERGSGVERHQLKP